MMRLLFGVSLFILSTIANAETIWRDTTLNTPFVQIPEGCFFMGLWYPEDPVESRYKVCVNAFQMMQFEVTNAQYRTYLTAHDSGRFEHLSLNAAAQPVVNITWRQAHDFAQWLSRQTGEHFRLPTEAEWEYAARARSTTETYFGDDFDQACAYANIGDNSAEEVFTWILPADCQDGYVVTAPVGRFQANAFGLYDMIGNVWEWTCSAYAFPYAGIEQTCVDSQQMTAMVFRGGGWATPPSYIGSMVRRLVSPEPMEEAFQPRLRGSYLGFRLVRELPPTAHQRKDSD